MSSMEPTRPDVDRLVDTRGRLCPLPIVDLQEAAAELGAGRLIELVSDDVGILADLPAWCAGRGHELVAITEPERGRWHGFVRLH